MRTLRDSWFMIRSDFRGDKLRILWISIGTILFMGYLGGMTSLILNDALHTQDRMVVADFMLISLIPLLGFTVSRRTMKYFSEDSYTKMLAYMQSLPIDSKVILCKRKIQAVFTLCVNGMLFFGIVYISSEDLRAELNIPSYIGFALTWIGYGLIATGLYIFIEYLVNGKAYLLITVLIVAFSMGISVLVMLAGGNLFFYSISCSKEWGLLSPIMWGTLLLGTISVQLFSKWTIHRLKSRNLV